MVHVAVAQSAADLTMLIYALAKFIAYSAWCFLGIYLFTDRVSFLDALKFGSLRWLLGLIFGLIAAIFLGSVSSESVTALYFGVYVPLRIIEWSIMVVLMVRSGPPLSSIARSYKSWVWVVGGVIVSFASDLASPEGMAGRFCVGRCLC